MPQHNPVQIGDRIALSNFGRTSLGTVTTVTPTPVAGFSSITITWDDGFEDAGGWTWPDDDLQPVD